MRIGMAVCAVVVAALLTGWAPPAFADEDARSKAESRALFDEGTKHYQVGEFDKALEKYKEAYLKRQQAVFLYNMAQCYRQMDKPEEAEREYRAYLRERPNAPNRTEVERFIADAESEIARRRLNRPPTGVVASDSEVKKAEPPPAAPPPTVVVVSPPPEPAPVVEPKKSKLWVLGVVAGVVVVGGAVGVGVAYGLPKNAGDNPGSAGTYGVQF